MCLSHPTSNSSNQSASIHQSMKAEPMKLKRTFRTADIQMAALLCQYDECKAHKSSYSESNFFDLKRPSSPLGPLSKKARADTPQDDTTSKLYKKYKSSSGNEEWDAIRSVDSSSQSENVLSLLARTVLCLTEDD